MKLYYAPAQSDDCSITDRLILKVVITASSGKSITTLSGRSNSFISFDRRISPAVCLLGPEDFPSS